MATTPAKRKVKHAGSRPNYPSASKQRLFTKATPPPAMSPAARLKVVDPESPKPTPPDALRRLESLERRVAELTDAHARALVRIHQLETQLSAEAQADAIDAYRDATESAKSAGLEAIAEAGVDAGAEDLGSEPA